MKTCKTNFEIPYFFQETEIVYEKAKKVEESYLCLHIKDEFLNRVN